MARKPTTLKRNAKFGKLTILHKTSKTGDRYTTYLCKCDCGNTKKIHAYLIVKGRIVSCGCGRHEAYGDKNPAWNGYGEISSCNWIAITRKNKDTRPSQKRRDLCSSFNITIEQAWQLFIEQNRRCAISGLPIEFGSGKKRTASLDRIDSDKGYELSNVQWVHKTINVMKNKFSQEDFIYFCQKVAEQNGYTKIRQR